MSLSSDYKVDTQKPMSSRDSYIAVAGNIGSGKSSLVTFLKENYVAEPFFEPNDDNPFLPLFYEDMETWAFHSQMHFLTHKFKIHADLANTNGTVIQDRTIFEDAEIFAAYHYESGNISEDEWAMYTELYRTICRMIRPPDVMIYLKCSMPTLRRRIKQRGRSMEQSIPTSYLKKLEGLYGQWLASYKASPVITIETGKIDYVTDWVDRVEVMEAIEQHIPGIKRRS